MNHGPNPRQNLAWYWLFLIPFAALLYPFYLKSSPALGGFPFFYWYQFAWLFVSAGMTWFVYRMAHGGGR